MQGMRVFRPCEYSRTQCWVRLQEYGIKKAFLVRKYEETDVGEFFLFRQQQEKTTFSQQMCQNVPPQKPLHTPIFKICNIPLRGLL